MPAGALRFALIASVAKPESTPDRQSVWTGASQHTGGGKSNYGQGQPWP